MVPNNGSNAGYPTLDVEGATGDFIDGVKRTGPCFPPPEAENGAND